MSRRIATVWSLDRAGLRQQDRRALACDMLAQGTMPFPPPPPPMRRKVVQPIRSALLIAALSALPLFGLAGELGEQGRKSALHVLAAFALLTLAFRLIGKRELSSMTPFELVTLMLIPEILSSSLQGEGSLVTSLSGLCMIFLLVLATSVLSQRFPPVQRLLESSPTVLVANGQLLEEAMNRERIAPDELLAEMRRQSITELSKVKYAVLESSGNISFVPQQDQQS